MRYLNCVPVVFTLIGLVSSHARADYPIMSHRYLADPGVLVSGGRVYLYNSNDDDNAVAGGYEMKSIVCVSSSDMKNWTDHGEVFRVPADASWASYSWAPYPLERSGKIYLYFGNNANGVGVATSTSPTAEFKDARSSALVDANTPGASGTNIWLFDPGALLDDDGQGYLSFGGNGESNARIIKLTSDLTGVSGSATQLSPKGFFEASFMFKRNDIYYFAYSTNSDNGLRIDYLTSSSPMSGYTYRGIIAGQPPVNNNNNHASEFEFNGKWYHAYHNRSVATDAGISTTYRRNLALEVLNFNTDGTIQQVTYTTDGVPQVGNLNPYERVEAETMNAQSGVETERCNEGGMDVTQLANGDWIKVRGVDFGTTGATGFSARVASTATGGSIELRLGSQTGTLIGTCSVPSTGGAQTWMTTTCNVTGATGVKDLYLKFTGTNSQLFNFNYWQFSGGDAGGGSGGGSGSGGAGGIGGTSNAGAANLGGTAGRDSTGGVVGRGGAASGGVGGGSAGAAQGGGGGVSGGSGGTTASASGGAATSGASASGGSSSSTTGGSGNGGGSGSGGSLGGSVNTTGSGGAAAGVAGSAAAGKGSTDSSSGCSCAIAGGRHGDVSGAAALGVLALVLRRRRRSS